MSKAVSKSKKISPVRGKKKPAKIKEKPAPKKEYAVAIGFEVGKKA